MTEPDRVESGRWQVANNELLLASLHQSDTMRDSRGSLLMRSIDLNEIPPHVFPESAIGRFVLGLLSIAFIPFSAIFLYACVFGHPGPGWGVWLIRIALQELFFALFAVSTCGLVWAVAAPTWLPGWAHRWVFRLVLLALIPFLIMAGMMLWPV